jgi:hypothetical protein
LGARGDLTVAFNYEALFALAYVLALPHGGFSPRTLNAPLVSPFFCYEFLQMNE